MTKNKLRILNLLTIFIVAIILPQMAFSMSSENFSIFADTVNYGGNRSTDSNFIIFDSIGEGGIFDTPTSTSANYALSAGFQSQGLANFISASTTPSSVNLGNLDHGSVASANLALQISTNATFGYSSTIAADGDFKQTDGTKINAVSDGAVSAGGNEFGFRTAGVDGQYNSADQGLSTTQLTIASRSNWTNLSETTITFKAAIAAGTAYGSFSQNVTITTTANY